VILFSNVFVITGLTAHFRVQNTFFFVFLHLPLVPALSCFLGSFSLLTFFPVSTMKGRGLTWRQNTTCNYRVGKSCVVITTYALAHVHSNVYIHRKDFLKRMTKEGRRGREFGEMEKEEEKVERRKRRGCRVVRDVESGAEILIID